jgi:aerobic-type carbon monoxide dehydrogenase small subunit (CoxS/CutS family)
MATIRFTVNGKARSVNTDPERSLLEVLREDLGLTGTKFGCGEAQCGACTVLVDNRPVLSCVMPVGSVADHKVVTIEGLSDGVALHPVQQAFVEENGMQCGYCTAGMVMGTVALLAANPKPTDAQIVEGLNGHLCRCSGYQRIVAAVHRASELTGGRG